MQKYIGVKILEHAELMNRADYSTFRGWQLPKDEDGSDEGYLVVYGDSNSNTDKYDGYVSWSPKEQFEEAYFRLAETLKKNSISQEDVDAFIKVVDVSKIGDRTTVVTVTLLNGFTITKASSSVSVENYDEKMGTEICLGKIKDDIWMLLGFLLRCGLGGMK